MKYTVYCRNQPCLIDDETTRDDYSGDILNEAITHALSRRPAWNWIVVYQKGDSHPLLTITEHGIHAGKFRFIKGRTLTLKDGTSFLWDGIETPENIMRHRELLLRHEKEN